MPFNKGNQYRRPARKYKSPASLRGSVTLRGLQANTL